MISRQQILASSSFCWSPKDSCCLQHLVNTQVVLGLIPFFKTGPPSSSAVRHEELKNELQIAWNRSSMKERKLLQLWETECAWMGHP